MVNIFSYCTLSRAGIRLRSHLASWKVINVLKSSVGFCLLGNFQSTHLPFSVEPKPHYVTLVTRETKLGKGKEISDNFEMFIFPFMDSLMYVTTEMIRPGSIEGLGISQEQRLYVSTGYLAPLRTRLISYDLIRLGF